MKYRVVFLLFFFLHILESKAQQFVQTDFGIKATVDSTDLEIQFFSKNIIRVVKIPKGSKYPPLSYSIIKQAEETLLKVEKKKNLVILKSSDVKVTLDLITGKCSFLTIGGEALLAEKDHGIRF